MKNLNTDFKIVVLGDFILDEYIYGDVNRISPEAPVPVVNFTNSKKIIGGSGNVCKNLKNLNVSNVIPVSFVSNNETGILIKDFLKKENIDDSNLILSDKYTTSKKTRVLGNNQQIVRLDTEKYIEIDNEDIKYIIDILNSIEIDAIIIQDYNKGMITNNLLKELMSLINHNIKLFIMDPHPDSIIKYNNYSFINYLKPNMKEVLSIVDHKHSINFDRNNSKAFVEIFKELYLKTNINNIIVTDGKHGMYYIQNGNMISSHESINIEDIFDVCGAGDTVLSMLTVCLLNNTNINSMLNFASKAAAKTIKHLGPYSPTWEEILEK